MSSVVICYMNGGRGVVKRVGRDHSSFSPLGSECTQALRPEEQCA